ncbi:hypothetical protein ACPCUV_35625 [Streptomyces platensis]|uniref:hypothetical protein n=1 Tax=Streptomyces platensis TaxID=58346 RepID=UPI003C2C5401
MADALKSAEVEVKISITGEAADSARRMLDLKADDGKALTMYFIEEDRTGRNRAWAASLKVEDDFDRPATDGEVGDRDSRRPRLTRDQQELLASVEITDDDLEGLVPLGPVQALKWKPSPRDLIHPLTAEFWSVGPDLRLLELSLRARPAEASGARNLLERALLDLGLQPPSPQTSKTRSALTALARAHLEVRYVRG